jgi:hypothetical protein
VLSGTRVSLRRRIERLEERVRSGLDCEMDRQLRAEERSRNQFRQALRTLVADLWELLGDRDRARSVTDDNLVQERREAWQRLDAETREQIRQAARVLLERERARQRRAGR